MSATDRAPAIVLTRNPRFAYERLIWACSLALMFTGIGIIALGLDPDKRVSFILALLARLNEPQVYAFLLFSAALLLWHWRSRHHEQLRIDAQGLQFTPLFSWWPQSAYRLSWADIERIELTPGRGRYATQFMSLHVFSRQQRYSLRPLQWYPPVLSWQQQRARLRGPSGAIATAFANTALGQALAAHGITVNLPAEKSAGFDLMAHRGSKLAVVGVFALLVYAVVDAIAVQQRYLDFVPWWILAPIALVIGIGIGVALRRHQLPRVESIGVGVLFAVALTAAGYPALLRLNQLTDWDGAETVRYLRQADGQFVASGFPSIKEEPLEPFWDQLPSDQHYSFRLYRGTLGFWQLDEQPVNEEMRAYYRAREKHAP